MIFFISLGTLCLSAPLTLSRKPLFPEISIVFSLKSSQSSYGFLISCKCFVLEKSWPLVAGLFLSLRTLGVSVRVAFRQILSYYTVAIS